MRSSAVARRLVPLLVALIGAARADEKPEALNAWIDKAAPSIVTVKLVLSTHFSAGGESQTQENRATLLGTVVDAEGLILTHLSWVPKGGDADAPFTMTPTGIRVVFEREDKECDAFLVATDATLDLAFLKVTDLGGRKPAPVDLSSAADPARGQTLYVVGRQRMAFDYAPYLGTVLVAAEVAKPRKAWLVDRTGAGYGLPAWSAAGRLAGFLTRDTLGDKEDEGASADGDIEVDASGGGPPEADLILPVATVKDLVDRARKKAAEMAQEAPAKKEEPAPKGGGEKK